MTAVEAKAQDAAAPSPKPATASSSGGNADTAGVAEIIVTAQKRSERMQDVPIAIAVIGGDHLKVAGVTQVTDLAFVAPSVTIQAGLGFVKPFIRGVGSTANGAGIESPVAIYVDNVYIADGPGGLFSFNNIDHIEVLKGPQGTLFGRNATGGLINVLTRDPTHKLEVEASGTYANYADVEGNLYVAGGLTDQLAAGVAVQIKHQGDGWGKNFTTGRDVYTIPHDFSTRGKLVWQSGGTRVHLSGDYTDRTSTMDTLGPAAGTRPLFAPAIITYVPTYNVSLDTDATDKYVGGGGSLRINQDIGTLELVSTTAYRRSRFLYGVDFDQTPARILTVDPPVHQNDRQFSQELQLQNGGHGRLQWTLGAFYFNAKSEYLQDLNFAGPLLAAGASDIITNGAQTTRSYALYAQGTYSLTDTTHFTGGFRYTWDQRGLFGTRTTYLVGGGTVPLPFLNGDKTNFRQPTWRLSLDQKLNSDILLYASYNRGFKSGGYNLSSPGDPAYLPEKIDAYEVGFKSTLLDRRVRLNGAFYYYDYSNMQVSRFVNGSIGIYNGARARQKGVDLDGEFVVNHNFSLTGGVAFLDSKFLSFPNAVVVNILPNGLPVQLVDQNVSGNRTPNSPKFTSSLGGKFTFPTNIGEFGASLDWAHNSGFFTEPDNVQRQNSYDLVNAGISWLSPSKMYSARIWGRNLLSQYVITQKQSSNFGVVANYQAPLTYGITIGFKL
ncbi:TonB-dependent receptor [Novosphingobium terrae]|uniref:TonB-dependent receptor n=1 Tax=Novosphingobium terrae TaxID=2726189 RepID=UPI00198223C0|nr:TonB-dependent receptor [Novosphingobium terrae]